MDAHHYKVEKYVYGDWVFGNFDIFSLDQGNKNSQHDQSSANIRAVEFPMYMCPRKQIERVISKKYHQKEINLN